MLEATGGPVPVGHAGMASDGWTSRGFMRMSKGNIAALCVDSLKARRGQVAGGGNVSATTRRPGYGRQAGTAHGSGSGRVVVTVHHFVLGFEPVFGFVSGLEATALRKQVGQLPDLIFEVDGKQIRAGVCSQQFRLARR